MKYKNKNVETGRNEELEYNKILYYSNKFLAILGS